MPLNNNSPIEYSEFRKKILKLNKPRIHKIKNSYGVYDAYKYIRKNKWFDIGKALTEREFYSIIRAMNKTLGENLLIGEDIKLPHRMGRLEVRKMPTYFKIIDGKIKSNLPIDWDTTLKLWQKDEQAYKERTLVKNEEKEIFKIHYYKWSATYKNKAFYQFETNRTLKLKIGQAIKNKTLDSFLLYG